MGGSSQQTSNSNFNQQQSGSSTLGSTPTALSFLPQMTGAAQAAVNQGAYTGPVVAPPTQANAYAATPPNVSGFVADPGDPLDDYTPDVQILDRYIAGATPTSLAGLSDAQNWASTMGGQVQDTAGNLGDFWQRVSAGEFLDPNTNVALQQYLTNMSEGAQDELMIGADNFTSNAISSGAYGGTGYGRGMAWALDEFNENDLAARSGILYNNYLNEMDRIQGAGAGASQAYTLGLLPGQTMMGLGDIERGYEQLDINNEIATNQEIERGQAYDIQDLLGRRRDTALQAQAGLENELGLANWNIYQQESAIRDEILRNQVDQMIAQAGLTNAQSAWDAERWGDLDVYDRFLGMLANPAFGEHSEGTSSGSSTTTTEQENPLWQDIMGGLSSAAQIYGMFSGNPAAMAGGIGGGGAGGSSPQGSGMTSPSMPSFSPIPVPDIDYSQFLSNPSNLNEMQLPWYLQPAYQQPQIPLPGG